MVQNQTSASLTTTYPYFSIHPIPPISTPLNLYGLNSNTFYVVTNEGEKLDLKAHTGYSRTMEVHYIQAITSHFVPTAKQRPCGLNYDK
jgi:hypothetical protein